MASPTASGPDPRGCPDCGRPEAADEANKSVAWDQKCWRSHWRKDQTEFAPAVNSCISAIRARLTQPTMTTASGPDPLTPSERATIAEFEREEPGLDPRPLLAIVDRLTAALAESLESISDALAGPNAVRNCDFRSPTVAEVVETATRLRARLETARERIAEATARAGEARTAALRDAMAAVGAAEMFDADKQTAQAVIGALCGKDPT